MPHKQEETAKALEDKGIAPLSIDPVRAKYKHTQSNILGVQVQYKF